MKYHSIIPFDVANGPGIMSTIFLQGCTHRCEGCFNKELHNFSKGKVFKDSVQDQFLGYVMNSQVRGVNVLGGEPFDQPDDLYYFLKEVKDIPNKIVWLWTGYLWEEVLERPEFKQSLKYIDVLIDGPFELHNKTVFGSYRGSYNQQIIDVKKSLEEKRVILLNDDRVLTV